MYGSVQHREMSLVYYDLFWNEEELVKHVSVFPFFLIKLIAKFYIEMPLVYLQLFKNKEKLVRKFSLARIQQRGEFSPLHEPYKELEVMLLL